MLMNGMKKDELEKLIREIVKEEIAIALLKWEEKNVQVTTNYNIQPLNLETLFPEKRSYEVWCKERFNDVK